MLITTSLIAYIKQNCRMKGQDKNEEETLIHHQDAVDPPQNEEETDMDLFPWLVNLGKWMPSSN